MNKLPDFSYVNGKRDGFIQVSDRGLSYGDGLFETVLYLDGTLLLLKEHLERLRRDCLRLQIALDNVALENELGHLVEDIHRSRQGGGVVKIVITRKYTGRGYGFEKNSGSNRILQFYPGLSYPKQNAEGVRLSLCEHHLPDNRELAGIKHLNRLDQVIAKSLLKSTLYQEAVVFGSHHKVIECISSNLFMVKDGTLLTADLAEAGVQGVMRDYIISTVSPQLGIPVDVRRLYLDDLMAADEIFICNSVFGIWPVIAIHVREYVCGKITRAIQKKVNELGFPAMYV